MGVADGQSVSFSDFWTLIQSVATSQHSILSGQGGPSCSCILLWPVRHSIFIITNFVLPRIPLSQCVTCPCRLSSRCSADSTGQRCSEQKLLQEYRIATIATIKMRSQSSRFPNYFISVVFSVLTLSSDTTGFWEKVKCNENFVHFGQANFKIPIYLHVVKCYTTVFVASYGLNFTVFAEGLSVCMCMCVGFCF